MSLCPPSSYEGLLRRLSRWPWWQGGRLCEAGVSRHLLKSPPLALQDAQVEQAAPSGSGSWRRLLSKEATLPVDLGGLRRAPSQPVQAPRPRTSLRSSPHLGGLRVGRLGQTLRPWLSATWVDRILPNPGATPFPESLINHLTPSPSPKTTQTNNDSTNPALQSEAHAELVAVMWVSWARTQSRGRRRPGSTARCSGTGALLRVPETLGPAGLEVSHPRGCTLRGTCTARRLEAETGS